MYLDGITPDNEAVQMIIPVDADEKLSSGFSSFLGSILNEKVHSSYIYNVNTHTMGQDPNKIIPGQQLALIHFSPAELTRIYWFFADIDGQESKVFAVDN